MIILAFIMYYLLLFISPPWKKTEAIQVRILYLKIKWNNHKFLRDLVFKIVNFFISKILAVMVVQSVTASHTEGLRCWDNMSDE